MPEMDAAPQSVSVRAADRWMERPIEVAVTEHPNPQHASTTKIWLTPESAQALIEALTDHLRSA